MPTFRRRAVRTARQLGPIRIFVVALFLIAALLIARFSWDTLVTRSVERTLFDWRSIIAAPSVDQDDRIVMVVYTDETLAATGKRSPLDRAILAKALTRIDSFAPKAIGIDILIDQPQPEDPLLIDAFRAMKTPVALAYASNAIVPDKILLWQQEFLDQLFAAISAGPVKKASISIEADDDNVLRGWPAKTLRDAPIMPRALEPKSGMAFADYRGSVLYRLPKFDGVPVFATIPIDTFATDALFASPEATELFRKQIAGKYVLIGGNIQDIDLFETPVNGMTSKPMWGMEIFAHMFAQQLDGKKLASAPNWMVWLAAAIVVLSGALTAASNARTVALAVVVVSQFALMILAPWLLQSWGIDTYGLPAFGWGLGWILAYAAVNAAARALGSEQRKFAQSALGKYLPRDIAESIMRNPESLSLSGEKREIFAVFTDLEGFTKLSHAIAPEMVATLLNRYLDMLSNVVLEHGGTIDKFVGDAVVAFWGAPISRPDDGERAARAAVALYEAGEAFRQSVPPGVPPIGRTRVGMHFGEAIVGNFGGQGRMQYTALGDSMNTASRLESANKQIRSGVLVSRDAADRTGLPWFRPLGRVVLRGRATPVEIMEPVPMMAEAERTEFTTIAKAAISGDVSAVTKLAQFSAKVPQDEALANFVHRLTHQETGGYFVLD